MKFKSKGLIAKIGPTSPPSQVIIQLGDSTFELGERDALMNVTTHDTTGQTHDMLDTGYKTPASFNGEILYDPADAVHELIRAKHDSGETIYLEITLPTTGAPTFLFPARVRNATIPLPVMGKLSLNVSMEGLAITQFAA